MTVYTVKCYHNDYYDGEMAMPFKGMKNTFDNAEEALDNAYLLSRDTLGYDGRAVVFTSEMPCEIAVFYNCGCVDTYYEEIEERYNV